MSTALWLLGRGTGLVSLLLLTTTVVLGVLTGGGYRSRELPRFALTEIHRRASLAAAVLLVVHVGSLWLDPEAQLRAVDVVVPFLSRQPLWWGLGTLALDLVGVVIVTSLLRKHIRYAVWRGLHWLGYAVWPVAFLHGLGSGSDAGTWWLRSVAVACFAAVAVAAGWRVSRLEEPSAPPRPRATSTPVG